MVGKNFEYDERGSTFYYFLVSFYGLVLLLATYYLWPRTSKKHGASKSKSCGCENCRKKEEFKRLNEPKTKNRIIKFIFVLLWMGFFALAYKASQIQNDHVEWNPYSVLGLDSGATVEEVKKAYRQLSKIHHPDRGGDEKRFVEITKAHLALTDEESKKNYDLYGNPDGPGAQTFGIALPSWLVSKEYSIWVLAIYGLIFMVIMPTAVGIWWYKSIKYGADSVLMDTTRLFMRLMYKNSMLNVKRVLAILSGSFEFSMHYNKEVIERPSDDVEVPALIKRLPTFEDNKKNPPLFYPYSVKARALLYAHLSRHSLRHGLDKDLLLILKKCPYLVQELIQVYAQLVMWANNRTIQRTPALATLDNIMKVSPMIIQAAWDNESPLFQLPHVTSDVIRHFVTKKRVIRTCADLARLPNDARRALLHRVDEHQYHDICTVLSTMPQIEMEVKLEVQDDEDKERITAGALVTARVNLKRTPLLDPTSMKSNSGSSNQQSFDGDSRNSSAYSAVSSQHPHVSAVNNDSENRTEGDSDDNDDQDDTNRDQNDAEGEIDASQTQQQPEKRSMWEKQKRKKGGKNAAKNKKKQPIFKPSIPGGKKNNSARASSAAAKSDEQQIQPAERTKKDEGSDEDEGENSLEDEVLKEVEKNNQVNNEDDLDLEDFTKKEKLLETKSKITHLVHCPFYLYDKYEYWWLYICDRKKNQLICPAVPVTTLIDSEEVELRFPAPKKPGTYSLQVCLRSDSYLDCDQNKSIKYVVHEQAEQIKSHPQWDFAEDEDKKSEQETSDEEYTEDDEDEDEEDDKDEYTKKATKTKTNIRKEKLRL